MLQKSALLVLLIFLLGCGASIKTASTSENELSQHKKVAILPFEIILGQKLQKIDKFTETEKDELRRYLSLALQRHLYDELKQKQKRFPFSASIQSSDLTDSLLSLNKISFAIVFGNNKKELCRLLGVDAVISSKTTFGKLERTDLNDVLGKGSFESDFAIYDSIKTEKIWLYHRIISDNLLNDIAKKASQRDLSYDAYQAENKYQKVLIPWLTAVDAMFRSFTADFPYKKK